MPLLGEVLHVQAATFDDINQASVFLKQNTNNTCTLAANAMMLRRTAMMRGDSDWANITESSTKGTLWSDNGVWNSYNYSGISVKNEAISGDKVNRCIQLLAEHPEGIVLHIFINSSTTHAVLLTDYTNGTFYCADPWGSRPSGRIPLSQAYLFNGSVDRARSFWYVTSPDVSLTPNDTENPVISNVQITDVNKDGYTVTCTVTDNVGIDRVEFPTWYEGQRGDEAIWLKGSINGNTASVRVNVSDWNNRESNYYTHIYAYDTSDRWSSVAAPSAYIDRTAPQISNVRIEQIDSTGYTVVCEVNDNRDINRVQFPTWTEKNQQDDLFENWQNNSLASGERNNNTFSYRVEDKDHNYERGKYYTDIYAYDSYGNCSDCASEVIYLKNVENYVASLTYNNHTYYLYDDLLSWHDAKNQCEKSGGHLATITSQGEQEAIQKLLRSGKRGGYFIGGYDSTNNNGAYKWVTGEPFLYSNWIQGEPNNEHYLEICTGDGLWKDNDPTGFGLMDVGYILEKDTLVESVEVSKQNLLLSSKGAKVHLTVNVLPTYLTNKAVTWKSSNPSVATVDQNGKVTAISNGTANITVTTQDGNKTAICKVTVNIPKPAEPTKPVTPDKPSVSATSIKLNKPSLTLYKGKTYTLKATVKPKSYNSGIKWSSSAKKYATVSSKGKITAKKSGRTVITAQTKNGKKATCIVNVKERKATKVKLSRKSLTLKVGRKYALKATVYPKNTTDTKKWTISKKGIVKVSSKGVVTGLKKGRCRITLKTSSGKSAYCNVKVE